KQVTAFEGPKLLVINKIDLVEQEIANERYEQYRTLGEWDEVLPISSTEGHGVEGLLEQLISYLPEGPLYYPREQITDQTERETAAEIIREAALYHLEQEVPHSLNVEVDEWQERDGGKTYVSATIYVERESQKGIVIGGGGRMLKRIASDARREIERTMHIPIYLDLWVKVREKWRDSEAWLNRWGYKPERS
ncbi:MAG: GTPase Era, partial [Chloroflexota bacterium]|nr:GTPase Era [Chloroflexota bacterium]